MRPRQSSHITLARVCSLRNKKQMPITLFRLKAAGNFWEVGGEAAGKRAGRDYRGHRGAGEGVFGRGGEVTARRIIINQEILENIHCSSSSSKSYAP